MEEKKHRRIEQIEEAQKKVHLSRMENTKQVFKFGDFKIWKFQSHKLFLSYVVILCWLSMPLSYPILSSAIVSQ